jgi:DNA-binding response OmpR family regulator
VVVNLLSNAFKFCTKGEVVIELSETEDSAWIHVRDTGHGIPADQIDRIFENFYQVEQDENQHTAGTGIGLFLVKELVSMHHGTIQVKSEVNEGSTFSVCLKKGNKHFLPGQIASAALSEDGGQDPEALQKELTGVSGSLIPEKVNPSVLIIEDNPDMMQYLADVLSDEYTILIAKDGEEGFRRALEMNPDVVISDVMMPLMDGYALCKQMKKDVRTSHIPLILLTAKSMHRDKIEGLQLGADDYLQKPFHLDELKLRIRYHLDLRKKIQEEFLRNFRISSDTEMALAVDDKLLDAVFSHIEAHLYDEQFGVEKLSNLAGMSRKQLNNKIKALTSQNANELIRNFRLRKAAYLLSEQGLTVSEACYQVGFNNLSYFSKCFTEFYGTRPSEYGK